MRVVRLDGTGQDELWGLDRRTGKSRWRYVLSGSTDSWAAHPTPGGFMTVQVLPAPDRILVDLLNPANRGSAVVRRDGPEMRTPGFLVQDAAGDHLVWGFTALVVPVRGNRSRGRTDAVEQHARGARVFGGDPVNVAQHPARPFGQVGQITDRRGHYI